MVKVTGFISAVTVGVAAAVAVGVAAAVAYAVADAVAVKFIKLPCSGSQKSDESGFTGRALP